ncbi:tRNA (adenosine(37)-N6)-dimethylallyltransferase MiaA [Sediminibacterium soli]|uniref:tRNA (adenosine(37)-N6)-dimethylallyltransferase MiaA n=1 Tax=Sediminibacterium soli TaxID=2698829 RepID=UPI00137AEE7E|nr:tRNA (adenosine(37)-N6)-dimethylallyltransferase MiaA [Sediminibacterium soli]NCI46116.1 tRNA (adenosine(37)-N6)-dimethylallyltransferase MiaA [Sediminibacterium soli]
MQEPTVIVVAGPTAVGKTAFAIALAKYFKTEIISADSRQCYREMKIGVARPSENELAEVPHHFIASHSVTEDLNAGSFERYALDIAAKLFEKQQVIVLVGGTGLYIQAFCEGIDPMPEVPEAVRQDVIEGYQTKGLIWLQKELQHKDPVFWEVAEQQNPQRLMRALEVLNATGRSIMEFRTKKKQQRPFRVIRTGLDLPKEQLHERIHQRVDQMMADGQLEEVRSLLSYREHNALQTVGYRELFDCIDGKLTPEQAVEKIKTNTRHYAKRQLTWFRKDTAFEWFLPELTNVHKVAALIER